MNYDEKKVTPHSRFIFFTQEWGLDCPDTRSCYSSVTARREVRTGPTIPTCTAPVSRKFGSSCCSTGNGKREQSPSPKDHNAIDHHQWHGQQMGRASQRTCQSKAHLPQQVISSNRCRGHQGKRTLSTICHSTVQYCLRNPRVQHLMWQAVAESNKAIITGANLKTHQFVDKDEKY